MGLRLDPHVARNRTAGLPQPEEVFLSWLVAQSDEADLAAAADIEIRRLRRYDGNHPGPKRLAGLFEAFRAELAPPHP
ncbi:hypothetical protein ATER59S_02731 [Aquamicrobium terrae]